MGHLSDPVSCYNCSLHFNMKTTKDKDKEEYLKMTPLPTLNFKAAFMTSENAGATRNVKLHTCTTPEA